MIEIEFFWILYLTLQVMNSSTSSRLLTKVYQIFARVRSSGKPRNGLWFLTKLNKCYQPRWDDEQSWDRHWPNVNLIDHPSRGWHSVKHVRGNLSGQSTSHQQNQGPRYFHDIHLFCLVLEIKLFCISYPLLGLGWLVGMFFFLFFLRLLVHLDNVASQFGLGLFGLTNGKLPYQDHIDKDAKGPPRGWTVPNRMVKGPGE